jgi:hypothetical protein
MTRYQDANGSQLSLVIFRTILAVAAATAISTASSTNFIIPGFASDLTIEDQISRQDPVQDKVTICHFPGGDRTKAHDMTVGESVVPDHLAQGDRIGSCLPTREPTITVEPPSTCISTENGSIGYARFTLNGFPIGSVIITGPESSELPLQMEVQAETSSVPVGFSTGEKTVKVFADTNRNSKQDPSEISTTKTFTITC